MIKLCCICRKPLPWRGRCPHCRKISREKWRKLARSRWLPRDPKAWIFITTLFLGCSALPPIPIEPDDMHNCQKACEVMSLLGCPEGEPLADGTPCTEFCEDVQQKGHALNPTCLMRIRSCSEIAVCESGRRSP